jgi:acyl-coenzyme A synthetase/AMP-(fatty) acid ligase
MPSIVLSTPERCPTPFNLADYVLNHGRAADDKLALEIAGSNERWSYGALRQAALEVAQSLSEMGLNSGDKILLRIGNTVEFPICFLAAILADLIAVPTSAALTPPEVDTIASLTCPALCIATDGIVTPPDIPVIHPADLHRRSGGRTLDPVQGDPDRAGYIVFTSGSASVPRAVVHAHRAIWARRRMFDGWYGLREDDRLLHAGAFNWTFTLGTGLLDPWARGATSLVPPSGTDVADLAALVDQSNATIFAAVPGVYRKLLKSANDLPRSSLRHGLVAGETLPDALRKSWRRQSGTEIYEALGMSECSTYISASPRRPAPTGAIGYIQDGRSVAVLAEDGSTATRGQDGALAIHRSEPGLMLGYLDNPSKAPTLPLSGDWFLTGDTVRMDPDDSVVYVGRSDDMMNAGGYRVSPLEVESAFSECSNIAECAAVAVQVKEGVSVIALFYTSAVNIQPETFEKEAERCLADYKRPRLYVPVEELPRNKNGKLDRKMLRNTYEASHGET